LKAHETKRLKLRFDILLLNFAFKIKLRRYTKDGVASGAALAGHAGHALYLPGTGSDPVTIAVDAATIGDTSQALTFTLELWIRKQTAAADAVLLTLGPTGAASASTLSVRRCSLLLSKPR